MFVLKAGLVGEDGTEDLFSEGSSGKGGEDKFPLAGMGWGRRRVAGVGESELDLQGEGRAIDFGRYIGESVAEVGGDCGGGEDGSENGEEFSPDMGLEERVEEDGGNEAEEKTGNSACDGDQDDEVAGFAFAAGDVVPGHAGVGDEAGEKEGKDAGEEGDEEGEEPGHVSWLGWGETIVSRERLATNSLAG